MHKGKLAKTGQEVVVLEFLGGDVGLVRAVCVTEGGQIMIVKTDDLQLDVKSLGNETKVETNQVPKNR